MNAKQRKELERLSNLASAEREEKRKAQDRKYLGRFFRYHNCYSCPQGPADYWWLYASPWWDEATASVRLFKFETDKNGKMEVEPNGYFSESTCQDEIAEATFNGAWKKFVSDILTPHRARKGRP